MSPEQDNRTAHPSTAEEVVEARVDTAEVADPAGAEPAAGETASSGETGAGYPEGDRTLVGVPESFSEAAAPGEQAAVEPSAGDDEAVSAAEEAAAAESFSQLVDQYSAAHTEPIEGELIEGRVIATIEQGVVIDLGGKFEGLVPASELVEEPNLTFAPNQIIEVIPLNQTKDGAQLYSYLRARRRKAWEAVERSHRGHVALTGKVIDRIKGGLVVDLGIRAFLPASQVDIRPTHDLGAWVGREITCRVLKMNRKRGNVVVSRRVLLEEELLAQRQKLLESLQEGAVATGTVKNITDYGVFVDLGGLDGLLHLTDISWGRVKHPSEVVQPGQQVEVKILKFDREKMRVSLGMKQLRPDPWETVPQRFAPGQRVYGTVMGVTDYGAFVEIEPGVEGLVHVSEMSWSKRMRHPSKIVTVGDQVEVVVLDVKPDQRRISLGLKQTLPDPWQSLSEKYPIGSVVTGRVRNITDFGAFVEIEDGIDGLIHVSDLSWDKPKNPSEVVKKGETVTAKVLKIDSAHRRLSLGIKQLNDIWADWFAQHKVHSIVRGKVARRVPFGVFVELAEGIEGLCHISEIEPRRPRGEDKAPGKATRPKEKEKDNILEVGQEYDFKIVKIEPAQHRIGLSYRGALKDAERAEISQYRSSKSSAKATIGDMILSKRGSGL